MESTTLVESSSKVDKEALLLERDSLPITSEKEEAKSTKQRIQARCTEVFENPNVKKGLRYFYMLAAFVIYTALGAKVRIHCYCSKGRITPPFEQRCIYSVLGVKVRIHGHCSKGRNTRPSSKDAYTRPLEQRYVYTVMVAMVGIHRPSINGAYTRPLE